MDMPVQSIGRHDAFHYIPICLLDPGHAACASSAKLGYIAHFEFDSDTNTDISNMKETIHDARPLDGYGLGCGFRARLIEQ